MKFSLILLTLIFLISCSSDKKKKASDCKSETISAYDYFNNFEIQQSINYNYIVSLDEEKFTELTNNQETCGIHDYEIAIFSYYSLKERYERNQDKDEISKYTVFNWIKIKSDKVTFQSKLQKGLGDYPDLNACFRGTYSTGDLSDWYCQIYNIEDSLRVEPNESEAPFYDNEREED